MNREYLERTQKILSQIFDIPVEQILPGIYIESLGNWDSHRFLFFVLALEEEFSIELNPEDVECMLTVENTARIIEGHCEQY
jgi:acyl carrier protein